eukprot:2629581-Rhodomonas_salina.1
MCRPLGGADPRARRGAARQGTACAGRRQGCSSMVDTRSSRPPRTCAPRKCMRRESQRQQSLNRVCTSSSGSIDTAIVSASVIPALPSQVAALSVCVDFSIPHCKHLACALLPAWLRHT